MRIACPSCSAAYDVPDSLMTAGRVVRCARCGGEWAPVQSTPTVRDEASAGESPHSEPPFSESALSESLPDEAPAPPLAELAAETAPGLAVADDTAVRAPPRTSAMDRLAAHPAEPALGSWLRIAWAASIVLVVLAAGGAYAWRSQIVEAWPPSAHLYAAFGMHPDRNATQ